MSSVAPFSKTNSTSSFLPLREARAKTVRPLASTELISFGSRNRHALTFWRFPNSAASWISAPRSAAHHPVTSTAKTALALWIRRDICLFAAAQFSERCFSDKFILSKSMSSLQRRQARFPFVLTAISGRLFECGGLGHGTTFPSASGTKADAVIARGDTLGATYVQEIGRRFPDAGSDNLPAEVNEIIGIIPLGGTTTCLKHINFAANRGPRYTCTVVFAHYVGDPQRTGWVQRIGAGQILLQICQPIPIGIH